MGKSLSQQSQALNDVHSLNIDIANREIFIGPFNNDNPDENGYDEMVSQKLAGVLIKNLRCLDLINNNGIVIHMQSRGGDINAGFAMYDAIKFSKSHITVIGYGLVASMGTIIMQAADTRILMPNCEFMVHYGYNAVDGTHLETKYQLQWADTVRERMMDIYVERCSQGKHFENRKPHQVRRTLESILKQKSDWFMFPKDAVEYGFVDGIVGDTPYETMAVIKGT